MFLFYTKPRLPAHWRRLKLKQLKLEITKGKERVRQQEARVRELPDIVVKVVCKYRAELFFKISRKTKLSRLFTAWTERMESASAATPRKAAGGGAAATGTKGADAASTHSVGHASASSVNGVVAPPAGPAMSFVYTHQGRSLDPDTTVEDAGIDDADEIVAVELMDLTGPVPDDAEEVVEAKRPVLKKNWTEDPAECVSILCATVRFADTKNCRAKRAMEEIFDSV